MPLPLLAIAAIAGTAALGIGKSAKAAYDQHDANETNASANKKVEKATERINTLRQQSGKAINDLGECKINVLNNSITPFIESFEKLHSIELSESEGLSELNHFKIDKQAFKELKELSLMSTSLISGVAGGTAIGAITAFGAYGGAMTFAAASTGTAIATLSGAAATNATLAFFGGGSLAVGGLGIAGGTAVLGGLVAAPALAVIGVVAGAKAKANRNVAYSNYAKAKEFEEEMYAACSMCKGIFMRANMFNRALIKLELLFNPLLEELNNIIETSGTDYSRFTAEQKKTVAACMSLAGAIKAILDTPILTEDGSLTEESKEAISSVQKIIESADEK